MPSLSRVYLVVLIAGLAASAAIAAKRIRVERDNPSVQIAVEWNEIRSLAFATSSSPETYSPVSVLRTLKEHGLSGLSITEVNLSDLLDSGRVFLAPDPEAPAGSARHHDDRLRDAAGGRGGHEAGGVRLHREALRAHGAAGTRTPPAATDLWRQSAAGAPTFCAIARLSWSAGQPTPHRDGARRLRAPLFSGLRLVDAAPPRPATLSRVSKTAQHVLQGGATRSVQHVL